MSEYMVPVNEEFVEDIARSIAKARIQADTLRLAQQRGIDEKILLQSLEVAFERLWEGYDESDIALRAAYVEEARAAISAINLKMLLIAPE